MSKITIYTDGAAAPNPGIGGCAAILICGNLRKEISQGYKYSTNNRICYESTCCPFASYLSD